MAKSVKTTPPSAFSTPRESVLTSRLPRLIEGFLLHGDVSGHSLRTIDNRRRRLGGLTWFATKRNLEELGVHELRAFFQYMRHGHEEPGGLWGIPHHTKALSSGTIKSYHSSLRTFFNWLVAEGDLDISPMERITPPVDRPDQVQPFTPRSSRRCSTRRRGPVGGKPPSSASFWTPGFGRPSCAASRSPMRT